jgi:hypothetical protein
MIKGFTPVLHSPHQIKLGSKIRSNSLFRSLPSSAFTSIGAQPDSPLHITHSNHLGATRVKTANNFDNCFTVRATPARLEMTNTAGKVIKCKGLFFRSNCWFSLRIQFLIRSLVDEAPQFHSGTCTEFKLARIATTHCCSD